MQLFGNYEVSKEGTQVVLNYRRSKKDWFDVLLTLGVTLLFSIAIYFLVKRLYKEFNWIYLLFLLGFCLAWIYKFVELISRIFIPTRKILTIDKSKKNVTYRASFLKSKIIQFNDVSKIQFKTVVEDVLSAARMPQKRIFGEINIVTINGNTHTLIRINTTEFIVKRKIEIDVYKSGKKIASLIANQLNVDCQWAGVERQ